MYLLLVVLLLAAGAAAAAAQPNAALERWLGQVPKPANHFTLLAGACGPAHTQYITNQLASQSTSSRFTKVDITGPDNILQQTVAALKRHCEPSAMICPSLVLHIQTTTPKSRQREADAGGDLEEVYRAFYGQAKCVSPEFGGVNVDCTRVWFVISSCMGSDQVSSSSSSSDSGGDGSLDAFLKRLEHTNGQTGATGASEEKREEELTREVAFELKERFGFGKQFTARLPLVVVRPSIQRRDGRSSSSTPANDNFNTQLDRLVRELAKTQQQHQQPDKPTPITTHPTGNNKIDFSLLDESHFLGQDWARLAAINALDAVDKHIKQTQGPIILFLLGSSGTGKTLLAKLIAQAYHPGKSLQQLQQEKNFAMFAMADYKSEHDVDSFTSPRQGLVGKGALVDVFEHTARPVVVFDEIEKAHPSLLNEMMLSMLDDNHGFVQDKKDTSKKYSTQDAIFVLTSNCFSEVIQAEFVAGRTEREVSQRVLREMERADPAKSRCAAFAKAEVSRRMKAGHAFSNLQEFGFVVFVPPSQEMVENMASHFLQSYADEYVKRGSGVFVWSKRAEQQLKRMAKQRYAATGAGAAGSSGAGSKHGGLSEVQSYLTGVLMQLMRQAMKDCGPHHQGQGQRNVLLHDSDGGLVARIVGCGVTSSSASSPMQQLHAAQAAHKHQVTAPPATALPTQPLLLLEEHEVEVQHDEESSWEWRWLVSYLFAFVLAVVLLSQPALALQSAVAFFSVASSVVSLGSVMLPHAGTAAAVAMLWPWLGWKSLLVVPVLNVLFNTLLPMSTLLRWVPAAVAAPLRKIGREVKQLVVAPVDASSTSSSSAVYVSFAARPSEMQWFLSELLGEAQRRIRFRQDAFASVRDTKAALREMSTGVFVLCVGRNNGDVNSNVLASLDEWNVLELLLFCQQQQPPQQSRVLVALHSSYLGEPYRAPDLDQVRAMFPSHVWDRLARETQQHPAHALVAVLQQWTASTFILCDDVRLGRLELMLHIRRIATATTPPAAANAPSASRGVAPPRPLPPAPPQRPRTAPPRPVAPAAPAAGPRQ